jgi:hypothetical protein
MGKYLFAIRAQSEKGLEDNSLTVLSIRIGSTNNSLIQFADTQSL